MICHQKRNKIDDAAEEHEILTNGLKMTFGCDND